MKDEIAYRERHFRRTSTKSRGYEGDPAGVSLILATDLHNARKMSMSISEKELFPGLRNVLGARDVLYRMSDINQRFEIRCKPSYLAEHLFRSLRLRRQMLALVRPIDLMLLGNEVLLTINIATPPEEYPRYFDFLIHLVERFEKLNAKEESELSEGEAANVSV